MRIETERLCLQLLDAQQLQLKFDNLAATGVPPEVISAQIEKIIQDGDCLYHSFWLLIRKADKAVVGSIAFKVPPNEDGEIEIGYGLGGRYEGHGYATEAVRALCDWAIAQGVAKNIIAETEPENTKSENVLQRCGFVKYKENGNTWWKYQP